MAYALVLMDANTETEISRCVSLITVLVLKDGTEKESSHHGWPFEAASLRDQGVLERIDHRSARWDAENKQVVYQNCGSGNLPEVWKCDKIKAFPIMTF